jgi:dihydrofolate reductase
MTGAYRIEAYAIASADGMIADATGVVPPSLQLDADQRHFEDGLDHVTAVVHGRHSQEPQPKAPLRRRLILTRRVASLARDPHNANARLWNPAGALFEEACAALGLHGGRIAVIGGPLVYSLFLKLGYDVFHLSRAVNVRLPGGLPLFAGESFVGEPEAALKAAGLAAQPTRILGPEVTLTDWTRL